MRISSEGFFGLESDHSQRFVDSILSFNFVVADAKVSYGSVEHMVDCVERVVCFEWVLEYGLYFSSEGYPFATAHLVDAQSLVRDCSISR